MGKIVVSQNVSLDGVVQDPTGEEGFRHGGWFLEFGSNDYAAWAAVGLEEARSAQAMLMGRRSDAYFGPRWLSRNGEWADSSMACPSTSCPPPSRRRAGATRPSVVLGEAERVFGTTSDKVPLRLLNVKTVGEGLAHLTYEIVRDA